MGRSRKKTANSRNRRRVIVVTTANGAFTSAGRRSILDLRWPARSRRIDLMPVSRGARTGFESADASAGEDAVRARLLGRAGGRSSALFEAADARALARRLEHVEEDGPPPRTAASHRFMRDMRIRIVGALLALVEAQP